MASRKKQTEIHPPKLQGWVEIGGIAVEAEFVHCYKYSVVDLQFIMCMRRNFTLVYPIYPPLFVFQLESVSEWTVCWPYWCEREGGVNIVLFISGSHLWTCVYRTPSHRYCSQGPLAPRRWKWEILEYPPYSLDMIPCYYDLFAKVKEPLRGTR